MTRTLWSTSPVRRISFALFFEPRDAWVGVFWDRQENALGEQLLCIWVCLLPFLPLHANMLFNRWPMDDDDADDGGHT